MMVYISVKDGGTEQTEISDKDVVHFVTDIQDKSEPFLIIKAKGRHVFINKRRITKVWWIV